MTYSKTTRYWLALLLRTGGEVSVFGFVTGETEFVDEGLGILDRVAIKHRNKYSIHARPKVPDRVLTYFVSRGWLEKPLIPPLCRRANFYRLTEAGKTAARECRLAAYKKRPAWARRAA